MNTLLKLKPGDTVDIIAPASRCTDAQLNDLQNLLTSWQLNYRTPKNLFNNDLLCANTDKIRAKLLIEAIQNQESKAIVCVRGGYGSLRLIPEVSKIKLGGEPKVFIGMSDATALLLYFQQKWQWPVIHGGLAIDKFSIDSIQAVKNLLFNLNDKYTLEGKILNKTTYANKKIIAPLIGGNLAIIQTSIGTNWQLDASSKILFLEETNERGYRIDRMLEHLTQANIFDNVQAVILGEFIQGNEPDGSSLIQPVLERFASRCNKPVIQISGLGHTHTNFPLPFNIPAVLSLGEKATLSFQR